MCCWFVAVLGQRGGLPSHGVDLRSGSVHLLRHPHLHPQHTRPPDFCTGPCKPGAAVVQPRRGLGGGHLGGHHHGSLLLAGELPGHLIVVELHPCGRGGSLRAGHVVLVLERSQVVQGPPAKLHLHVPSLPADESKVACA